MKTRLLALTFALIGIGFFSGGSASAQTYQNPSAQETESARRSGPCRDPWISIALVRVAGKTPQGVADLGDCNYKLYNGGSWNSYNQLAQAVKLTQTRMAKANVGYQLSRSNGTAVLNLYYGSDVVGTLSLRTSGGSEATVVRSTGYDVMVVAPQNSRGDVLFMPCLPGTGLSDRVFINLGPNALMLLTGKCANR